MRNNLRKINLFGNRQLLAPGGVNKSLGILKYPYVHSGSSRLLSWPETKIFGFQRDLMKKNEGGAALVEFVLILPILLLLMVGSIDVYRYIYITQKIEEISARVADWSAAKTTLSAIQDFFYGAYNLGVEFNFKSKGGIYVTGVQNTLGVNSALWTVFTPNATTQYGGLGSIVTLPSPLSLSTGDSLIIVEVTYNYTPLTPYLSFLTSKTFRSVSFSMPRGMTIFNPLPL